MPFITKSTVLWTLGALTALGHAIPTQQTSHVLHEKRATSPRAWRQGSRIDADAILPIRIGLVQTNLENGEDHLMDVSHPHSPNYGKHWTAEEVHAMFAPAEEAVREVKAWLEAAGIGGVVHSDNKGWLAFDIPASQAEELFNTEYHEYEHKKTPGSEHVKVGCDSYHVPSHLAHHIDYITPGVALSPSFVKVKRDVDVAKRWYGHGPGHKGRPPYKYNPPHVPNPYKPNHPHLPPDLVDCGRNVTPACLRALYDIPKAPTDVSAVDRMGLYETGDTYSQADLNLFFAKYASNVPQGTHPKLDSVDGGAAPVDAGSPYNTGESDIDMDIAFSLIYPQKVTLYQVDAENIAFTDGFNTFLDALDGSYCTYSAFGVKGDTPPFDATFPDNSPGGYKGQLMCGTYKPTRVISVSYGEGEIDFPYNYTRRQCNEFMKLGLQGTTFVWASGDHGVASYAGDDTPSGCLGANQTIYNPGYPTCPYVTSVGATRLYDTQTVNDKESAMQEAFPDDPLFSSGGGFSNYFPVPKYQKSALSTYFAKHDPGHPYYSAKYSKTNITNLGAHGGIYNRVGRGLPDVSANGAQFRAFTNLTDYHFFGTSLSAPIWGSLITLVNQERTKMGKGPVGFINPVLYENAWIFNDIVNGSNPNCGSSGFAAVPGWDPVTGLGTPNYPKLLQVFKSLP